MTKRLAEIRESFRHPGIKGDGGEDIVREFLSTHLPKGLEVGTGEIIDHSGRHSRQCDVVIVNPLRTPTFLRSENHLIFPVEGVAAVIEVKTRLSRSDVPEIVERMKSVKDLQRTAYQSPWKNARGLSMTYNWYGSSYDYPPLLYFVLSFECDSLEGIWEEFAIRQHGQPIDKRVDSVYCLDKGALVWVGRDRANSNAIPTPSLYWSIVPTQHVLLLFYTFTFNYLAQNIDMVRFDVSKYVQGIIPTGEIRYLSFQGCSSPEEVWTILTNADLSAADYT